MTRINEFVIIREFNASRELLFDMWTEPKHLNNWWGPEGYKVRTEKMEFKSGGTFHYSMESSDGNMIYGKFIYREILRPEKMVFVDSFSDASEGITRHPFAPTWPAEVLCTLVFTEQNGKTKMTLTIVPINANETEIKLFTDSFPSMNDGWGGTLEQFKKYMKKINN